MVPKPFFQNQSTRPELYVSGGNRKRDQDGYSKIEQTEGRSISQKATSHTADSKKSFEGLPVYLQQDLLDPSLVFKAETFRLKPFSWDARDKAFAKVIVILIAWNMRNEINACFEGNKGYNYGGGNKLSWDDKIGYPGVEAFKNERISFILNQVKL